MMWQCVGVYSRESTHNMHIYYTLYDDHVVVCVLYHSSLCSTEYTLYTAVRRVYREYTLSSSTTYYVYTLYTVHSHTPQHRTPAAVTL